MYIRYMINLIFHSTCIFCLLHWVVFVGLKPFFFEKRDSPRGGFTLTSWMIQVDGICTLECYSIGENNIQETPCRMGIRKKHVRTCSLSFEPTTFMTLMYVPTMIP